MPKMPLHHEAMAALGRSRSWNALITPKILNTPTRTARFSTLGSSRRVRSVLVRSSSVNSLTVLTHYSTFAVSAAPKNNNFTHKIFRSSPVCFYNWNFSTSSKSSSKPDNTPSSSGSSDDSSENGIITANVKGSSISEKGILAKLWDRYSIEGQTKRIILGERLFRSAQFRANDITWYREARLPYEFRPRHAILTMHIWFLHKRLLADRVDPHAALLVQEELFDILWNDTRARIRAEGVSELTVNKHLKDVQELTFMQCTHYDHAFQEYANDQSRRFEELALAIWIHILNRDEEGYEGQLRRFASYVEYQFYNVVHELPDQYFWEGRIPWGNVPDFSDMTDNDGKELPKVGKSVVGYEELPKPWVKTLTDAGESYYWNTDTNDTTWKKPV